MKKKLWIFDTLDSDSLLKGKLKIWIKNIETNERKYCTWPWINMSNLMLDSWIDWKTASSLNWEKEMNSLLKNWWDWKDLTSEIIEHLSSKYWLSKTLDNMNKDDIFAPWLPCDYKIKYLKHMGWDLDVMFVYENEKLIKVKVLRISWVKDFIGREPEFSNWKFKKSDIQKYFDNKYWIKIFSDNISLTNWDETDEVEKLLLDNFEDIYFWNIVTIWPNNDLSYDEWNSSYSVFSFLNIFDNSFFKNDSVKKEIIFENKELEKNFYNREYWNKESFQLEEIDTTNKVIYFKKNSVKAHFSKPYSWIMFFKLYKKEKTFIFENIESIKK